MASAPKAEENEEAVSFGEMGLDSRLLRALKKKGLETVTPVQAKCIPLALEGKDIVARARTGSGKTLAYLLPVIHKILAEKADGGQMPSLEPGMSALILVPTRELCQQVRNEAMSLADFCGGALSVVQLTAGMSNATLKAILAGSPDLVVATPGRLVACLKEGVLAPASLDRVLGSLVLDEADLLLSFGYEEDLRTLAKHIPRRCQCLLMSATSSADVDRLKRLVLHNPVTLTLTEVEGDSGSGGGVSKTVQQFAIRCPDKDKLLYALALLKLDLIQRKALIFVNSIDSGFRLKLFLEHFGIRTAVLNAELPQNSRLHILQEFNRGLFDYLIATDTGQTTDAQKKGSGAGGVGEGNSAAKGAEAAAPDEAGKGEGEDEQGGKKWKKNGGKGKKGRLGDGEFGVVRGIDFKNVRTVINVDMPATPSGYVHRVGRTGRAGAVGLAISIVSPKEEPILNAVEAALSDAPEGDEPAAPLIGPFPSLTKNAVEALRYRAEDMVRSISKSAIKEARAKELRLEIMNSERLKSHFEDNPGDLDLLKHDKVLLKHQTAPHLKYVPLYLRDPAAEAASRAMRESRLAMGADMSNQYARRQKRKRPKGEGAEGGGAGGGAKGEGVLWQRKKGALARHPGGKGKGPAKKPPPGSHKRRKR